MTAALVFGFSCVALVLGYLAARRRPIEAPARSDYADTLDALARLRKRPR